MNEDYETRYFANSKQVNGCKCVNKIKDNVYMNVFCEKFTINWCKASYY